MAAAGVLALTAGLAACGSSAKTGSSATSASTSPPATSAPTSSMTTVPATTTTSLPAATTTLPSSIDGAEIDRLPTAPAATSSTSTPNLATTSGQEAFLRSVFSDMQTMWEKLFSEAGVPYSQARLVLFTSAVRTACGDESADVGPFYCSGDGAVYLDVSFFRAMEARFGVGGDFAEAYVVAHEFGHHIQNLLGITHRVAAASEATPSQANALSVRVELQADCFAGVWAHSTYERNLLEAGDIEEALKAAQVVGDDFLANAQGVTTSPDSWTHGSSAQRQQWFTTGYEKGTPDACDTLSS